MILLNKTLINVAVILKSRFDFYLFENYIIRIKFYNLFLSRVGWQFQVELGNYSSLMRLAVNGKK